MWRPDRRGRTLAAGAVAFTSAWVAVLPNGTTYAAWSDVASIPGSARAGVWLTDGDPPLPDQCLGMVFDRIIIGTNKDDTLHGTDRNDLIFGLQGKDVLNGFAGQDCLVGGNGKDELLGEDGDDVLVGGNAKDRLTGGSGTDDDVCDGGRGKNTLIQCALPTSSTTTLLELTSPAAPTSESVLVLDVSEAPDLDAVPETDSGASVEDPPEVPLVEPTVVEPAEAIDPVLDQPEEVVPTETPADDAAAEVQP